MNIFLYDIYPKCTLTFSIPRCKIDSYNNNGFLHGYFVENLIKSIEGVCTVQICPLSGVAHVEVYKQNIDAFKEKILNLKDFLGNKINIIL